MKIVRYVNFYPPCDDTQSQHPWRTTSWHTEELAEENARPGRLTARPVRVEFETEE